VSVDDFHGIISKLLQQNQTYPLSHSIHRHLRLGGV